MRAREPLGATHHRGAFELSAARPRVSRGLSSPAGRIGLAGMLAMALLISLSAAHTELLLPQSLRRSLGGLAGVFGHVGLDIGLPVLIAAMVLMFLSYAVALRAAKYLSRRAVLVSIAALNALVLVAPPLLSTDLFSYIAYGRLGGTYGVNPYLYGPNVISFDPLYHLVGVQWTHTPTAYGPLFTALSYPLAGLNIATNVFAYKGIAALSLLAVVVLVWHAAQLRGIDPVKAVALVGLNPVIVIYGVGGGHNDLLMLAFTTLGLYALLARRERLGGATVALGAAIKLTGAILL
ncbi:MAG: polyprenol phosphomannose-dependent alpha 1,6 mannosyltransferase MptB, partial [Solirubrobacteraceae bacterium]